MISDAHVPTQRSKLVRGRSGARAGPPSPTVIIGLSYPWRNSFPCLVVIFLKDL